MRANIPAGIRRALIAFAVIEILLSFGAIGVGIASLVITMEKYTRCYYYYDSDYKPSYCDYLDYPQYTFSLTSQGLWAGTFIVFSACCKIRFGAAPSKSTEQYSTGFSVLALIMTIALASLEGLGAFQYGYYYTYNWDLHGLHISNFVLGCTLFVFTLTTMILSSIAIRGCCRLQNQTAPLNAPEMPMMFVHQRGHAGQALVGNVPATVGHLQPGVTMLDHQPMPMGNEQFQNVGAVAVIAPNTATQRLNNQLPAAGFRRENTIQLTPAQQHPQIPQSREYSQIWTAGVLQSNTNVADSHPMSSGMYPVRQATLPNIGPRQISSLEAASLPLQQQHHPNVAAPPHPSQAEHSLQAQNVLPPIDPDGKNLVIAAAQPQPAPGAVYSAAAGGGHVQEASIQVQQQVAAAQALQ